MAKNLIFSMEICETRIFKNDKLKTLRVFFGPLDLSDFAAKGSVSKEIIKIIQKKAIEG